jgi:hypothetical protein
MAGTKARMTNRPLVECFFPLFGLGVGFFLAVFLQIVLPTTGLVSGIAKLWVLLFAAYGWMIVTIIRGKRLECGGRYSLDDLEFEIRHKTTQRYILIVLVVPVVLVISVIFLMSGDWALSAGLILITFVSLIGEIGWGNPLKLVGR